MGDVRTRDRDQYEYAIRALEADATAIGATAEWDANVRFKYQEQIRRYVASLRARVTAGQIGLEAAAREAHAMRDATFKLLREPSSAVGRAIAEWLKREGPDFNTIVAKYTKRLFGEGADFTKLGPDRQNQVYRAIIESAGRSNREVDLWVRRASRAGRALIVLSIGISVYRVATSPTPAKAATREVSVTGAGIGGSVAGGLVAGLVCGPGYPVCATLFVFAGGALAAFGTDYLWSGERVIERVDGLSLDPLPTDADSPPRSRLMAAGADTGAEVPGVVLEAAFRVGTRHLLFTTDDVPFEEGLHIVLVDGDWTIRDAVALVAPYNTGHIDEIEIVDDDRLRFGFFADQRLLLTVHAAPVRALPFLGEPRGVFRKPRLNRYLVLREES